jgi:hypothetical protein
MARQCYDLHASALVHLRAKSDLIKQLEGRLTVERENLQTMLTLACPHWSTGAAFFAEDGLVEYDDNEPEPTDPAVG